MERHLWQGRQEGGHPTRTAEPRRDLGVLWWPGVPQDSKISYVVRGAAVTAQPAEHAEQAEHAGRVDDPVGTPPVPGTGGSPEHADGATEHHVDDGSAPAPPAAPAEPAAPAAPAEPAARRWRRRRFGWMLAPLGIYAVSRLVQLWLLDWMMRPTPGGPVGPSANPMRDKLLSWDAALLVRVAVEGYPRSYVYAPDGRLLGSTLAFFPGYPLLIRLGHAVTRADAATVAIAVAWICAGVLAVLVCALGTALWDRRTGLVLTALLCAQPMSVVFSMAYSEPVFLMFAVGALLAAYRHRWLLAGGLGLAAGLTRPTGVAVALALLVAAVVHVSRRSNGPRRWWALAGAGLAATGVPAYLIWVGLRLGEPTAWF
jgi:hypothetical protein